MCLALTLALITATPIESALAHTVSKVGDEPASLTGVVVDIVSALKDSRASLKKFEQVAMVRSYLAPGGDLYVYESVRKLASHVAPSGKPVSLGLWFGLPPQQGSNQQGPAVVLSLGGAEKGALKRLAKSKLLAPLHPTKVGQSYKLSCSKDIFLWMWMDGPRLLVASQPIEAPLSFNPGLAMTAKPHIKKADGLLYLSHSSPLLKDAAQSGTLPSPEAAGLNFFLSTLRFGDQGGLKMVAEIPALGAFSGSIAGSMRKPSQPALWGPEATSLLQLNLAPTLIASALAALPNPPVELDALHSLDGRFSLALFDGLSDWGIAAGAKSPQEAVKGVTAMRALMEACLQQFPTDVLLHLGPVAQAGFSIEPTKGSVGLRVFAHKSWIVVTSQPKRQLPSNKARSWRDERTRSFLIEPHLVSASTSINADWVLLELYRWGSSLLPRSPDEWFSEDSLPAVLYEAVGPRISRAIAQARAISMLTQDLTLSLDVRGPQLIVDAVASKTEPDRQLLNAVNRRFEGDYAGYKKGLWTLALQKGSTRAGTKAKSLLGSSDLVPLSFAISAVVAVAVPNFQRYRQRALNAQP